MKLSSNVLELSKVSVEFEKELLQRRNLKYAISSLLKKKKRMPFFALMDVDLSIKEGERIGVIGRNGSGKSTLLKVLSGVIVPQKGDVYRDASKNIMPLLELGIGFHPDLTGRENCYLAGSLIGYSKRAIDERMEDIISFSELEEFIDEPLRHYSSGMYARLAFTLATDIDPDILFVDEVFGVGDEFFIRKCIVRMQRLMKQGMTTILVSHNVDFLVTQCQRLIWLDSGRIIMDGEPGEVANSYRKRRGEGFSS